jgi:hypothetical protein
MGLDLASRPGLGNFSVVIGALHVDRENGQLMWAGSEKERMDTRVMTGRCGNKNFD